MELDPRNCYKELIEAVILQTRALAMDVKTSVFIYRTSEFTGVLLC